ncbi:hypothetical protein CEXT_4221 [Caerostris extrusa]|uniref:Uncharacterized protein n=1 Tax=Caerostris extrusa TaxID=172846 RepID=A0AAV4S1U8_CAEEX|nr:hypothetical protein CEXT_4221 [Caerostris extrusa]
MFSFNAVRKYGSTSDLNLPLQKTLLRSEAKSYYDGNISEDIFSKFNVPHYDCFDLPTSITWCTLWSTRTPHWRSQL